MKTFSYISKCIFALVSVAFFSSCNHKDLWYGSDLWTYVKVKYIYDDTKAGANGPESVDLYLYEDGKTYEDSEPYFFQTPKDGGEIRTPYSNYYGVAFNNDSGALRVRNAGDKNTIEIYTRDESILAPMGVITKAPLRAKGAQDERCVLSPEYVWSSREPEFDVYPTEDILEYVMPMDPVWLKVVLEIRGVLNFNYLADISCAMSGLSEGFFPGIPKLSEEMVTIPFAGLKMDAKSVALMKSTKANEEKDSVFGELICFGHCPSYEKKHYLTLYAVLTSGEKYMYTYDVTDQFHSEENKVSERNERTVYILIEDLPVPTPIANEGEGMSMSMDDWIGVDIDLNMR